MTRTASRHRQGGAVIITVALLLLFLLGFMGFALDFGRLYIVKTELQTAMDSCALSAAQELDSLAGAVARARSAGRTAANLNRVNLQSSTWDDKGQVTDAEVNFFNSSFTPTTADPDAAYVECAHMQPDVRLWLIRAMAAFSGDTATFPATQNVFARAIAKRGSSQTACPIPIALKAGGGAPPMYGLLPGQWVLVWGTKSPGSGEFGWYNLDGSTSAKSTKDQLESGVCNTRVGDQLGTPGAKTAVDEAWNYRFGIYKNGVDPSLHRPDYSGYSYTATNWKNPGPQQNAYSGTPAAGSDPTAQNFVTKRAAFASFDNAGTSITDGSQIVFGNSKQLNSFKTVATPGAGGQHAQYGASDRRIATVPVIDAGNRVMDYLCVFMLHPMSGPNDDVRIEVIGSAGAPSSPCTTSGLPGGSAGPLVPVLVR
jgi:Flp pilus assembly protein TadG